MTNGILSNTFIYFSVLLAEYLKWLPESAYAEVTLIWPPLDNKTS